MTKLSKFKINSTARRDGDWVSLGDEYGDIQIRTRGLTDEYNDAVAAGLRGAAIAYGGVATKVPGATVRDIRLDALHKHVFCGEVRHAENDDGTPATWQDFSALIAHPDGVALLEAAANAASRVGLIQAKLRADAVGNSPTPFATTSDGHDTPASSPA